jgi:MtN3 and saliva related transmembrane protein
MQAHEAIGYVAAVLTTGSFFPQAVLTYRARRAQGVSLAMYSILSVGVFLWLVYGLSLGAWPVIIANAITLVLALFILAMRVRYG